MLHRQGPQLLRTQDCHSLGSKFCQNCQQWWLFNNAVNVSLPNRPWKGQVSTLNCRSQVEDRYRSCSWNWACWIESKEAPLGKIWDQGRKSLEHGLSGFRSSTQVYWHLVQSSLLHTKLYIPIIMSRNFYYSLASSLATYEYLTEWEFWAHSHTKPALAQSGLGQILPQNQIYISEDSDCLTWHSFDWF